MNIKENGVTVADMESASIAYICKLNKVECIVIKGISDFPLDEKMYNKKDLKKQQTNLYAKNTPIIMENIVENYLEKFI